MSKDIIYAVDMFVPRDNLWHRLSVRNDFEMAEQYVKENELEDMRCIGKKFDYRIVKITCNEEVVV